MPLPLPIRKSIRDAEPKKTENLERINKATDKEWTFEVDWEANLALIEASSHSSIGSLYQDEILGNIASNLEKNCKDPLTKESLNEATSNSRIVIRVNEKINGYWAYKFENGDLVLEHKKSICNTSDVTYFDIAKVIPSQAGALPLKVRQDIESVREKQQELLEEIAQTTGSGEWILEVDWNTAASKIEASQKESIGNLYVNEVLNNISSLLKRNLGDNATMKEAFNESTSARTIVIQPNDKLKSYWDLSIKDGTLLVQHQPSICNTSDVSYWNLPKTIPVPGSLTLVAKLDLEKNKEYLEASLQKIKEATGEEYTFDEACIEPYYEKLEASQKESIGSLLYNEIIPNLAGNIARRMADEMVKEAFLEITSSKTIIIQIDPKQKSYWDLKFKDGSIVLSSQAQICNTSDVSYFDFEKLL